MTTYILSIIKHTPDFFGKTLFRFLFPFLMGLFILPVSAQEYEIVSFDIVTTDLSARRNPRIDLNGKPCALIKVYTNDNIAEARGAVVGEIGTVGMEKWIYVEDGSKQLELVFDNHWPIKIKFDDYNIAVVSQQMTYILKLRDASHVQTVAETQSAEPTEQTPVSIPANSEEDTLNRMKEAYENNDFKKAMELAMEIKDNPEAQLMIGMLYDGYGNSDMIDHTEAMKWFQKAAASGNTDAMTHIGLGYDVGSGVTQDKAEGMKWLQKAADLGNADAMYWIGWEYKFGNEVTPQDYVEAIKWFRKAADLGNAKAMEEIGFIYEHGFGKVTQDMPEAIKWYQKAADLGNKRAKERLEELK